MFIILTGMLYGYHIPGPDNHDFLFYGIVFVPYFSLIQNIYSCS